MLIVVESGTGGVQLHIIKNQVVFGGKFLLGAPFSDNILNTKQDFGF